MAHIKKPEMASRPYGDHSLAESGMLKAYAFPFESNSSVHIPLGGSGLGIPDSGATTLANPTPASSVAALPLFPEHRPPPPPPPAVDGGTVAWLQCLGSFFLFFNSWGIVNSFGVFQTYYEQTLLHSKTSSDISWIGSVQACLIMLVGCFTGPLFDAGRMRPMLAVGTFFSVFGMFMSSLCTEGQYWQILLAQGLTVGLGLGCLLIPSVAVLPTYFTKKKGLALGLGASGSSLGGIIYPIVFHETVPRVGFGWAVRIMGFIMLVTLIIPLVCMRQRVKPSKARKVIDLAAWTEAPFLLFNIAELFVFLGLYVPFFYAQLYAIQNKVIDEYLTFYLLAILNAGSFFGRIIPNFIADSVGPLQVLAMCGFSAAILGFAWISVLTPAAMILFAFFYGFFSASFVSLPPVVVATLTKDPSTIGGRMGMLFIPSAAGLLAGTPVAGAILTRAGWLGLVLFCGLSISVSVVFVIAARVAKVGWGLKRVA